MLEFMQVQCSMTFERTACNDNFIFDNLSNFNRLIPEIDAIL